MSSDINLIRLKAQVSLTLVTLVGFILLMFCLLVLLVWPQIKAPSEIIALVSAAIGSLGTTLNQQNGFFFAHPPQGGTTTDPDPTGPESPASH